MVTRCPVKREVYGTDYFITWSFRCNYTVPDIRQSRWVIHACNKTRREGEKINRNRVQTGTNLHLPLFDVGWFSIATEETLVVRPHQAREGTQQQLERDKKRRDAYKKKCTFVPWKYFNHVALRRLLWADSQCKVSGVSGAVMLCIYLTSMTVYSLHSE